MKNVNIVWQCVFMGFVLRLILFIYMNILSGYLRSSLDIYGICMERGDLKAKKRNTEPTEEDVGFEESHAAAPVDPGGAAAAASSSSSSSKPRPANVAEGRRRVDVKALHKRAIGTLTFVLELLASDLLRVLAIMICVVTEPLAREHANHMVFLKGGSANCRLTYALLAVGIWKCTCCAVFLTMQHLGSLQRMGLTCDLAPLKVDDIDEAETCRQFRRAAVIY
jgi:hypothetical protein